MKETPLKGSLSKYRDKVSEEFFQEIFEEDLCRNDGSRRMFKGHHIYAMDGDQLSLPASPAITQAGYRGSKINPREETHYPKMYTVQTLDLVNGTIKKFSQSIRISEQKQAWALVKDLEQNSITLYDRLYDCYQTAYEHERAGNYFFARVKVNNAKAPKAILAFAQSNRRTAIITMYPPRQKKEGRAPIKVRFIKVKNPRTQEVLLFMTNTSEGIIRRKDAAMFYLRRWGIESNFKDLTDTLKMTEWRSKKPCGILQEIYALLWLVNNVRRQMVHLTKAPVDWLDRDYQKGNFKLICGILMENFRWVVLRKTTKVRRLLVHLLKISMERRRHLSRSYPRQLKMFGKTYKNASRTPRRKDP